MINKGKQFSNEADKLVFIHQLHNAWLNWLSKLVGPKNPASRSYRFLARQIEADFEQRPGCRKIVFTPADSLECCNEILLMFAYFLRDELNCRVLVVDATFRQDGVASFLKETGAAGFIDLLYDPQYRLDALIKTTAKDNIFLLPAGRPSLSGSVPLQAETFRQLLDDIDSRFDYVLFQQSSILEDTRHLFLAPMADLTILVAEEGQTLLDKVHACQKTLKAYQIPNVRLVMSTAN